MPSEQFAAPLSTPPVVVIGDVMMDDNLYLEYTGEDGPHARRASLREQKYNLGGAGNAAVNVAAMGTHVALVGVVGDDVTGGRVHAAARARMNFSPYLFVADGYKTPRKLRAYDRHTLKLRIDDEGPPVSYYATRRGKAPLQPTPKMVVEHLCNTGARVLVTVDHGKGFLLDASDEDFQASEFQKWMRTLNVPVIVDPRPNRNWPFIGGRNVILKMAHQQLNEVVGRPLGLTWDIHDGYMSPSEARWHFNKVRGDLLATKAFDCDWLWLTYGDRGMSIGPLTGDWCAYVEAAAGEPVDGTNITVDPTGCGDTCTAAMAHQLARDGYTTESVLHGFVLANRCAGVASRHLGCHVTTRRLYEEINCERATTEDLDRVLESVR